MNIPDEAVEAGCAAIIEAHPPVGDEVPPGIRGRIIADARIALEAAAPYMLSHEREQTRLAHLDAMVNRETKRTELADAWDEAYGKGFEAARGEPDTSNPYRSQA